MAGNAAEWVADTWDWNGGGQMPALPVDGAPWMDGLEEVRVVRGASWMWEPASGALLDERTGMRAEDSQPWIGFRCCRSDYGY